MSGRLTPDKKDDFYNASMTNAKDLFSPHHLNFQKNVGQSPFPIQTPSHKPLTPLALRHLNIRSGLMSPLMNPFLLSSQLSPGPSKFNHSLYEINNLLFEKKTKNGENMVSSEIIKERIKPSSFVNIAEGTLNLSQGLKAPRTGLIREDYVSLLKPKNLFLQKKFGSVQSFEQNYGDSQSKVYTPVQNMFHDPNQISNKRESPGEVSLERRQSDEKKRTRNHKTNIEEQFFSQFKETILDQNNSSIFKQKFPLKKLATNEQQNSSEKIHNRNVIVGKGDKNLLVCPTPTKKSSSGARRAEKLLGKRDNDQLASDQALKKPFREFCDFDLKNTIKNQFQQEFLRLLKLDLSKDKIVELIKSDYQPMLDFDSRLGQLGKSSMPPRPRLELAPKMPRHVDFDPVAMSNTKGIYMEMLCLGLSSESDRVNYLDLLDEAMYKGPREYKKQTNREKKTFRVRRYNFFWHYNPELFDSSARKRAKRLSFSGQLLEKNPYRAHNRNKTTQKERVFMIDSPETAFAQVNQLRMSSNEIRSERIRNRLLKTNLQTQTHLPLDIDFSDERLVVSQARKPNEKQTPDQTLEYLKYLAQETTGKGFGAEQEKEENQYKKKKMGESNSPRETRTSKKNKFITPQLFSGNYHDYKNKTDLEDQKETAKKQQGCTELFKESPTKTSRVDPGKTAGVFELKSPIQPKSAKMFGSFNQISENVPYETPRNEFGQNKLMENMDHSDRFVDKKESAQVSKNSTFIEAKFQNVKKTSKKYHPKHFTYLNSMNPKSPRTPHKPKLIQNTPENGFLHTKASFLDKALDFSKLNAKDLEDFSLNPKTRLIDSSIKNMESVPLNDKIKNLNEAQFEDDFLRRPNAQKSTSKLAEINNLIGQLNPQFSKKPLNLNPTLIESSAVRDLLLKNGQSTPSEKKYSERKGCFCKNTECLKNYCSCFKNGLMCLDICECKNCENHENSQRRQNKMRSLALRSQTSSDRKKSRKNQHQEMRELLNSKINASLKGNPQDLFNLSRSAKKSQAKCREQARE